jgi:hypothetical protein
MKQTEGAIPFSWGGSSRHRKSLLESKSEPGGKHITLRYIVNTFLHFYDFFRSLPG